MNLNDPNYVFTRLQSLAALLVSYTILCLGHGLLNTVVGLRANAEGYSDLAIGFMTSGYFAGFIAGTAICGRMIPRVGHIRCFSIFASLASALILGLMIHVHPVTWFFVRFAYGACLAALYMVMESWLNLICKNKERGQILSFYMITNYLAFSLSQGFMFLSSPDSFTLFALASLLLSVSLVPVAASRTPQPQEIPTEKFRLKELIKTSRLATIGVFTTGVINGSFWGFGAIYLSNIGMSAGQVGWFIATLYIGGLVVQWPVGYFSDRFDRRGMIVAMLFLSSVVSFGLFSMEYDGTMSSFGLFLVGAFCFGGVNNTLHSLFLALANDYLRPGQVVKASGGLLSVNAVGALTGPLIAMLFTSRLGDRGLMLFLALFAALVFVLAVYRYLVGREIPRQTKEAFVLLPRSFASLDPRRIMRRRPSA